MSKRLGRPIIQNSARQKTPWKAWAKSRAWYYWHKKYGDLPEPPYPFWDVDDTGVEQPESQLVWDAHEIGLHWPPLFQW